MTHIVVLGAGIGGCSMAFELRSLLKAGERITVVSDRPSFQFTPSNPWVAVGWRQPAQIEVPLDKPFARKGIEFIAVGAQRVEPAANRVVLTDGRNIDYDYLVIATGPELAFDEIEGLGPDGETVSICTTDHAAHAAEAWQRFLADPGPIVVGAVQGASCFGPAYEFAFILDTELRRRRLRDRVPITYVTAEPYIGHLGLDGVGDTKGLLESEFRQRHIKWLTNTRVEKVAGGVVHAVEVADDGADKARHELPFAYAMMLPAFRGIPAVCGVEGLVNPRGFVLIDKYQANPTYPNVFAVGVAVAIPPVGATPLPVGVPKTGFMIESMVTATAHNLRALMDGRPADHEATWNALCLADFGDRGVAFIAMPQIPPRNVNWAAEGKWVHLAKIAFEKYFLHKVRRGVSEAFFEKHALQLMGFTKVKEH